jgi:hypothetical protein
VTDIHNHPRRRFLALAAFSGLAAFGVVADAGPVLRIMPLGDSITAGYTDNPDWNVPFGFGYRSGLYTRLTNAGYSFQFVGGSTEPWTGIDGTVKTVSAPDLRKVNQDFHRGYGGAHVADLANNVVNWLNTDNPDVILLMAGINDIGRGSSGSPTAVEAKLKNLVQTIVTTRPNANLIVAQITPYAGYTDSIVQYNNYIKNTLVPIYASLGHRVTTVDQYSNLLTGGTIDPALYANGINHPNGTAYDKMAQTWFNGIKTMGTKPPEPPHLIDGSIFSDHFSGSQVVSNGPGNPNTMPQAIGTTWNGAAYSAGAITPSITVAGSMLTLDSGLVDTASISGLSTQLSGLGRSTDWGAEIRFKVTGSLATNEAAGRDYFLLSGIRDSAALDGSYGIDLRLAQDGSGADGDTYSLGWWGYDSNSRRAATIIATGLNKEQLYTVSAHRKSDGYVDIYLDGSLISTQAAINADAADFNPLLFEIGDGASSVAGTVAIDYVNVGRMVPEPGSIVLLGMGCIGLLARAWRHRRRIACD